MKKRSLWILILSALLCLSMLFSACSPADSEGESENLNSDEINDGTSEVPPQNENVNYKAILDEWSKYISSVGYEEQATYKTATPLFETYSDEDRSVSVTVHGNIAEVVEVRHAKYSAETNELISPRHQSTTLYDLETGNRIVTGMRTSQNVWNKELGRYEYTYSVRVLFNTIIEVVITVTKNIGDDLVPVWICENTYSYYMADSNAICEGAETGARVISNNGVKAVEINDKIYHCRDGEIILITASGNAHAVPDFTMEYGKYRYSFANNTLQVIDEQYKLVVDYSLPAYLATNHRSFTILSDGSAYFYANERCSANEEHYDYETEDGERYRVWHVIVDLNGNETVIDAPFIYSELSYMGGFVSNFDTEDTGIELNGNYQYAEIVRIEDGYLANDVDFVILDNKLDEVVTLPKILKNQISVAEGFGNGKLLVAVDNIIGIEAGYVADMTDGTVARFFDTSNDYKMIKGGIVLKDKVYNNVLEEVYDLTNYFYSINGDAIFFSESQTIEVPVTESDSEVDGVLPEDTEPDYDTGDEYEDSQEYEYITVDKYYVGYVNENGEFIINELGEDVSVDHRGLTYIVSTDDGMVKIYNRLGERIFLEENYSITSINTVATFEEGIVIKATYSYYDELSGIENIIKYEYYTIK